MSSSFASVEIAIDTKKYFDVVNINLQIKNACNMSL